MADFAPAAKSRAFFKIRFFWRQRLRVFENGIFLRGQKEKPDCSGSVNPNDVLIGFPVQVDIYDPISFSVFRLYILI